MSVIKNIGLHFSSVHHSKGMRAISKSRIGQHHWQHCGF